MCKKLIYLVSFVLVMSLSASVQAALVHQYTFENGTANDSVGTANGSLVGGAVVAGGALVTSAQNQWMEMSGAAIAMNTYPAVSIEAWYTPKAGANTSWSMLAYFGATNPSAAWMGTDYFFMTSARNDNKSRAAISVGDSSSPWADESGADGPEYDDGIRHQMVGTLTATDIALYIDGVLISTAVLGDDDHIGGISQQFAYLAKGGYGDDPEWIGSIHEFSIYNHALSAGEVAANWAAGPIPEPATMVLLGLGSLALLRRRKS